MTIIAIFQLKKSQPKRWQNSAPLLVQGNAWMANPQHSQLHTLPLPCINHSNQKLTVKLMVPSLVLHHVSIQGNSCLDQMQTVPQMKLPRYVIFYQFSWYQKTTLPDFRAHKHAHIQDQTNSGDSHLPNVFTFFTQVASKSESQEPPKKMEKPKFQAFTGKKYSLKG